MPENSQDEHGRNHLLASYITYVFSAPFSHSPSASPDYYPGKVTLKKDTIEHAIIQLITVLFMIHQQ